MSGPAGADVDELLTLAARNSERYVRMAPGALDEPLRQAVRPNEEDLTFVGSTPDALQPLLKNC